MPGEILRLLGVDLDRKLAQIRVQVKEFRANATHQIIEQIKEASFVVGLALGGPIAASATLVIALVALYRWVEMHKGPFRALTAVGAVTAILAGVMFMLAFGRKKRKPASVVGDGGLAPSPSPPPPSRPVAVALSDALPRPPPNASLIDILTHHSDASIVDARGWG